MSNKKSYIQRFRSFSYIINKILRKFEKYRTFFIFLRHISGLYFKEVKYGNHKNGEYLQAL